MSIAEAPRRPMTAEEFLALPDDGVERDLIRGEVREYGMTRRNPNHSWIESNIAYLLAGWMKTQPRPRGRVHSGEAAFLIRREPLTLVGVDVAVASAELVARLKKGASHYDGPPTLAVEILSPSDKHEDVVEKINLYTGAAAVVWVVDPDLRTLTIHRPGQPPEMRSGDQVIVGDPYLPGFRASVAAFFED